MSFSGEVKSELCRAAMSRGCCARAELYGALLYCNTFTAREVRVITESESFAQRLPKLLDRAFAMAFDRLPSEDEQKYIFQITEAGKLSRIIDAFGFDPRQNPVLHINFGLLEEDCCRSAFLRGVFLSGGSITDPAKRYHLELVTSHAQASRALHALLTEHLDRRYTIEELSRRFLINTSTLKEVFKAVYGLPIATYMKESRVRRAMELLRETDGSIAAVAAAVGYETQSKFTKAFKDTVGVLPSVYRRTCRDRREP